MNERQKQALLCVQDGHNIYLGGSAGTGKSFVVKEVASWAKRAGKRVAITCTTGVACSLYPEMFNPMTVHKWSGIGDGRLTVQQLVNLTSDDRYTSAIERIKQVDILIVDEISMLSKRMLEKLEAFMRCLRENETVFGGTQVVLVGDFLQLPPVRNVRYSDPGGFCFHSVVFPAHRIFLTEVIRQQERTFAEIIHNVALGIKDYFIIDYVKRLSRPLNASVSEVIRLFSSNLLTDIYNRDCLIKLEGDVHEFESIDEGEDKHLATLTVQKTLWLKKNAKVLLLRNLSDQLVNGLCGRVIDIREGEVDVHFPTLDKICCIKRMNFAVFDPSSNRNLAVRNQIPLKLCYAMTIHKAQGSTLDRVEVDCRQIFQPGQLAVAMGRVKSPDGLRVVNFSEDAIITQPPDVADFLSRESVPLTTDLSCCHYRLNSQSDVERATEHISAETLNCQPTDCDVDISQEFDDETDKLLEQIVLESSETSEPPEVALPPDFELEEVIRSLAFGKTETLRENQIIHNQWIEYLLDNYEKLNFFCSKQYSYLYHMYNTTMKSKQSLKEQSEFFKSFQEHTTSRSFEASVLDLMPESDHVHVVFSLAYDIMSVLRKMLFQKASEKLAESTFCENLPKRNLGVDLVDTSRGKIRYIGGYVVAKLQYRTNVTVQRCAYKADKNCIAQYERGKRILKYIHSLKCSEASLVNSEYPETLKETSRKQNISRGLTNITDRAFKFFEDLVNVVLSYMTGENLNKYGLSIHKHITDSANKDINLHENFMKTVCACSHSEEVSFDTDLMEENVDSLVSACLREVVYTADVLNELLCNVVELVIAVLFKQFSKDIVSSFNIKKTLEHRKQIRISTSKDIKSL